MKQAYHDGTHAFDVFPQRNDGGGLGLQLAVVGVCGAAIALALLPAVTGITVLLGTTLPLRFEPQIGLAGLIGLKLLAAGWGIAQAAMASRAVGIASMEAG